MPPSRRRRPGRSIVGQADADGTAVYLADETSLVRVPVDGSEVTTEVGDGASVLGTPAQPTVHDGEVFAAWLPQGDTGRRAVEFPHRPVGARLRRARRCRDQRRPTFVASDDAIILNETRTGWVWTVPDGALVASSQNWSLDDRTDPDAAQSEEQLSVVHRPQAPDRGRRCLRRARGQPRDACRCS